MPVVTVPPMGPSAYRDELALVRWTRAAPGRRVTVEYDSCGCTLAALNPDGTAFAIARARSYTLARPALARALGR